MFNLYIIERRQEISSNRYDNIIFYKSLISLFFKGLILPFDNIKDNGDEDIFIITRFLPNHSFCFSTKARVPIKISVECIKLSDCKNWETLYNGENDQEEVNDQRYINIDNSNFELINKEQEDIYSTIVEKHELGNYYDNLKNMLEEKTITLDSVTPIVNRITQYQKSKLDIEVNKSKDEKSKNEKFLENNELMFEKRLESDNFNKINNHGVTPSLVQNNNQINKGNSQVKSLATKSLKSPFGQDIELVEEEIKRTSPYNHFSSFKLFHFIAKADDDLRQEQLVMQFIKKMKNIFQEAKIPLWLRAYHIEVTSSSSGLIEFIPNTNSIDGIKKQLQEDWTFSDFFCEHFRNNLEEAKLNFTQSLAAYSLICYLLQIKDRHNGNILMDKFGHIIHIDFGFVFGISPGNLNFESAPFKLTKEYIEIMGNEYFEYFKLLILRGFLELKKHIDYLVNLLSIMAVRSKLPCFSGQEKSEMIIIKFREKFHLNKSESDLKDLINELVDKSKNNFWTNKYDYFQYYTNGIKY